MYQVETDYRRADQKGGLQGFAFFFQKSATRSKSNSSAGKI